MIAASKRLAVFLPNWIGDVAMATPFLRELRQNVQPGTTITGVMRPYVQQVLAGTQWLDEELVYEKRTDDPARSRATLVERLRERELQTGFLLTNSLSTALMPIADKSRGALVMYGSGVAGC